MNSRTTIPTLCLWPPPPDRRTPEGAEPATVFEPLDREVHVWAASLAAPPDLLRRYRASISLAELARAERFRFERHRNRFIAGRGLLRAILGQYLGLEPTALEFVYGSRGKPFLRRGLDRRPLYFNLAHSGNVALAAVTRAGPVGIDVERIRPLEDADELVARCFSLREQAAFRELAPAQRTVAFYNLWTRKEAWLKATGEGIGYSLQRVEVSFLPGAAACLVAIPEESGGPGDWSVHDLCPFAGFAAAVAFKASSVSLRCWCWPRPAVSRRQEASDSGRWASPVCPAAK